LPNNKVRKGRFEGRQKKQNIELSAEDEDYYRQLLRDAHIKADGVDTSVSELDKCIDAHTAKLNKTLSEYSKQLFKYE
jgi:hypothetical protein